MSRTNDRGTTWLKRHKATYLIGSDNGTTELIYFSFN